VALNRLWGLALPIGELADLGLAIGADVPVFVHGRAAWAEGVGEQLTFQDWPECIYVVVDPGRPVATRDVFQAAELTRNSAVTTIRDFLAGGGRNDCAPVVRALYREISEALDFLARFGEARLTGTGGCVFVALPDETAAQRVLGALPARWRGWVVHGVNRSPLLARLACESS
jgi:4-diphosphocytidyl-2-C-methyl-D-erythritol kinase